MTPNDTQIHHFADGLYAKELRIPKGTAGRMHVHAYDHLSVLSVGHAWVITDGTKKLYAPGSVILIKKGVEHEVYAVEDVVWLCIHATTETDPEKIDAVIVGESSHAV